MVSGHNGRVSDRRSLDRDIKQVRIAGMNNNSGYLARGGKANMAPGLARIGGPVHAIACRGRDAANTGRTGAHVNNIGIAWGNGNGPD